MPTETERRKQKGREADKVTPIELHKLIANLLVRQVSNLVSATADVLVDLKLNDDSLFALEEFLYRNLALNCSQKAEMAKAFDKTSCRHKAEMAKRSNKKAA